TGNEGSLTLVRNGMLRAENPSTALELEKNPPPLDGLWSQIVPAGPAGAKIPQKPVSFFGVWSQAAGSGEARAFDQQQGTVVQQQESTHPVSAGIWKTAGRPVVDGEGRLHVWSGNGTYWISQPTADGFLDLSFSGDALPGDGQLMFGSDGTLYAYTPNTPAL